MLDLADNATQQISPTELEFLEGIFDRVCMCCDIERPSERADQLARFIVNEFRAGVREEALRMRHVERATTLEEASHP